jgi:hypothetical protein
MKPYGNLSGNSGIRAYQTGPDFIRIKFEDNSIYLYTNESTGAENIARMKKLASNGQGLCTFISTYVKNSYALKE